jgi:uncharacterized protein YjbI with pentapeptide repeats
LSGTALTDRNLEGINFRRADLERAELSRTNFGKADLTDANLTLANIDQAVLAGAALRGAVLRKASARKTRFADTKLHMTDFTGANLSGADLRWVALADARFSDTNLNGADLSEAFLHHADMRNANLAGADFSDAHLGNSDLTGADMTGADLTEANLQNLNLTDVTIGHTVFANNDLSTVIGLETVQHRGPSVIGVDTIFRSRGCVPESFLRGCGVPEDFIIYVKSFTANPIEFYSCFISYSTQDQDFAERLHADLQSKGVRCWFAPHDVRGGKKLYEQIDEAIRLHDKLLLILSPHSMKSEWVKTEIANARKREVRDQRRVLFPIRLAPFETLRDWDCFDADTGKDSAREIREYFIPDFSNWKNHDSYREAFQRLIIDLKASDSKPK